MKDFVIHMTKPALGRKPRAEIVLLGIRRHEHGVASLRNGILSSYKPRWNAPMCVTLNENTCVFPVLSQTSASFLTRGSPCHSCFPLDSLSPFSRSKALEATASSSPCLCGIRPRGSSPTTSCRIRLRQQEEAMRKRSKR